VVSPVRAGSDRTLNESFRSVTPSRLCARGAGGAVLAPPCSDVSPVRGSVLSHQLLCEFAHRPDRVHGYTVTKSGIRDSHKLAMLDLPAGKIHANQFESITLRIDG
jgi:hypothetical protein